MGRRSFERRPILLPTSNYLHTECIRCITGKIADMMRLKKNVNVPDIPVLRSPAAEMPAYTAATGLVLGATGLFLLAGRDWNLSHDVDLLYLPIVALCANRYGARPAIAAAVLSVALWDYFFIEPLFSMHIGSAHDVVLLAMFLVVSLFTANMAERVRATTRSAAILEERNRMAREIHDTLAQGLTGIVIQLQVEERLQGGVDTNSSLHQAKLLAEQCLEEARRSVTALRAKPLEELGLIESLRRLLGEMTRGLPVETSVNTIGQEYRLPESIEANLMRIGQEAVTNALRHSGADKIEIEMNYSAKSVQLTIVDSGRGFVTNSRSEGARGFGMEGITERAAEMHAQLSVDSSPGEGTRVSVIVPVRRQRRDLDQ